MPDYLVPGVYVEEVAHRRLPLLLRESGVAGFAGIGAPMGPAECRSLADAAAMLAGDSGALALAAEAFFAQGGRRLFLARDKGTAAALARLGEAPLDLIAVPGLGDAAAALIAQAARVPRLALIDTPPGLDVQGALDFRAGLDSPNAALFWPWLRRPDGALMPPSGAVAGLIAAGDRRRGLHRLPHDIPLSGVSGLETAINLADRQRLNPENVNGFLDTARGIRLWGGRTLSHDPEHRYIPPRRLLRFVEATLQDGLGWAVFEPNDVPLWTQLRAAMDEFLHQLWRRGMLAGSRPEQAFFARCGRGQTMTQADLDRGRLVCDIGVAPLRPAEFTVIRLEWVMA